MAIRNDNDQSHSPQNRREIDREAIRQRRQEEQQQRLEKHRQRRPTAGMTQREEIEYNRQQRQDKARQREAFHVFMQGSREDEREQRRLDAQDARRSYRLFTPPNEEPPKDVIPDKPRSQRQVTQHYIDMTTNSVTQQQRVYNTSGEVRSYWPNIPQGDVTFVIEGGGGEYVPLALDVCVNGQVETHVFMTDPNP